MYAVIFRAKIKKRDDAYSKTAARMRELAENKYGCKEFTSVTERNDEIAISYWKNLEQVKSWRQDTEHLAAQAMGRSKWYSWYRVQVVEIVREYTKST